MEKENTTIVLDKEDTAIVLKPDGRLQVFLRKGRGEQDKPTNNEIVAYVISNLMKDQEWLKNTVDYYTKTCRSNKD